MTLRSLLALPVRLRTAFLRGPLWLREPAFITGITRYYRSAAVMLFFWIFAWNERFLSRPARMLIFVFLFCSFFSSVAVGSPALILLGLMTATALADFIAGWIFRPKLSVTRSIPPRVVRGAPFEIRFKIRNKRKLLPAVDLLAEPYGEGKFVFRPDGLLPFTVRGGEEKTCAVRFLPLRRGELTFPCCMVESSFPFNIFKHAVRSGTRETILVHPSHRRLKLLPPEGEAHRRNKALSSTPLSGNSMDFLGCRKFQTGDQIRRIHWRATAKHNTLIVKDFQQEQQTHSAILADVFAPGLLRKFAFRETLHFLFRKDAFSNEDPIFEAVLSLAASVLETLTSEGSRVTLFSCSGVWERIPDVPGSDQLIYDKLAYAAPCRADDPLPRLTAALPPLVPELENIFVILRRWDKAAKQLRTLLKNSGIPARFALVTRETPPDDMPREVHVFRPDDILEGKADTL